jgi:hypothetical protein
MEDYLPRWLRVLNPSLQLLVFGALILAGAMGEPPPGYWPGVAMGVVACVTFAISAAATVQQRPNYLDKLFGPAYRRLNVYVLTGMQFLILFWSALALYQFLWGDFGIDTKRVGYLTILMTPALAALSLLAKRQPPPSDGGRVPLSAA